MTAGLGLLCAPELRAQDIVASSAMTRTLSLEEFVQRATERDTEFEAILIEGLRLRYERTLRLPAPDLLLDVRSTYQAFIDADGDGADTAVALSKLFPLTGTRLSASYAAEARRGLEKTSEGAVTLAQSIAENAFGRSTRILDRIVGLEVEVARHQIIEAYEDYLATLISAYYEWYEAYESLRIGESALRTNAQLLESMRARQRSRIALPIDVNKARLQVVERRENLIGLTERYRGRLNVIERAMRETLGDTTRPVPPPLPEAGAEGAVWTDRLKTESRTYAILDLLEKSSRLNVKREADDLLPSVEALFGVEAVGETGGLRRKEEATFGGVALSWPLPDVQARAERRVAEIERRATALSNQNVRYALETRLKNLALQVERERELIRTADEKIALAADILEAESENYRFGRATLNDYLQAVNDLDNARFDKISHEVLLRQLQLEFRRLTDVLVSPDDVAPFQPRD